ncbi:MAG: leucyl aminopeptidase, partial [Paracoccus sp. (in: a-proteobacteria)]
MTQPAEISFIETDTGRLASHEGRVALIVAPGGKLPAGLPRPVREAALRALESKAGKALKPGQALDLAFPAGMAAEMLQLVALPGNASVTEARKAGAAIGAGLGKRHTLVVTRAHKHAAEIALGIALRVYEFTSYQTPPEGDSTDKPRVSFMVKDPEAVAKAATDGAAVAEGVFFTRDLVNEPANVLTTSDFADRLKAMETIGLSVEVLEEKDLAKLGMRALLAVGQGSESPSKV